MSSVAVIGVRRSLWRAVALFRVVTLAADLALIGWSWDRYAHPWVAAGVGAGMVVVTAVVVYLALSGRAHRGPVVIADLAATVALTLATVGAQTPHQLHGGLPTLTTIWAAGPVLEAGFLYGWLGGLVSGAIQLGAAIAARQGADNRTLSSGIILLVAGVVVGYVATLAIDAEAALATAVRTQAAMAERERLAGRIHDGVLQVLALVHRAGRDEPGDWGHLSQAAGEQEAALRRLLTSGVSSGISGDAPVGSRDLASGLRALAAGPVTVSAPAGSLLVESETADEVEAAVTAALHNVAQHAGPDASVWVLLEDLDGGVRVTVRDDGAGFAADRLAAAAADGRLGVAASIRARIERVGGQIEITSAPGEGTTVEFTVPGGAP